MLRNRVNRIKHSTRILHSFYFVKLENLPNLRIKIEQINSIKLKFDSTITLIIIDFNNIFVTIIFVLILIIRLRYIARAIKII